MTLLLVWLTIARSTSGAVKFGSVVFLKFAVASATGRLFAENVALFCSVNGDAGNAVNLPVPSPLKNGNRVVAFVGHREVQDCRRR